MNKYIWYLPYDLTHSQPDGYGNKLYFKLTQQQGSWRVRGRSSVLHINLSALSRKLSYQPHAKLSGMQKFQQGHFFNQMTDHDYSHMQHAKG